ncbi:CGNR zinc finger domain-containing protein [Tengunoibacter tsumagoiensis]|uniref:Zinc finger CGNR domain-containing protein n=1 Tax=Tengunoibacter tsumagoiensis TaxID=2014871 RepID=A0A402A8U8_9CHLR|nr:ABATE domain-containing protein [Tengunoibacter tsumagoiensis]GCE15604.1 hypothetical protein KTT_54630 [Tengunoibacter tsumagoiensis]
MSVHEMDGPAFEFIGGNLCLDFANTLGGARGSDTQEHLPTYDALVSWSLQAGIITAEQASLLRSGEHDEIEAVLARAHKLREALYGLFSALARREQPVGSDLATLNAELEWALAGGHLIASPDGVAWQWPTEQQGLARMLSRITRSAATLLIAPERQLIRECASPTCSWLFLDNTKNHRRRWCSPTGCGNLAKVRSHRQRRREQEKG